MQKAQGIVLEDILSEQDIQNIINAAKPQSTLVDYDLKPAAVQGAAGFLGEHYRLTLNIRNDNKIRNLFLFIKVLPIMNKAKAEFITENKFFKREILMYQLFDEMRESQDLNSWHTKTYILRENIIVMPDLVVEAYKTHTMETFDTNHVLVSVASVAHFHASFLNFVNKKSVGRSYCFLSKYGDVLGESLYLDSPWLRAGAKLTINFLKEFSSKWTEYPKNLLEQLEKLYITGCCSLKEYEETVNVVVHKDLWVNNILFNYQGDVPITAVLIDFQCIGYAPPAFDIMSFLYFNTSRTFRHSHEADVLNRYYTVFLNNVNEKTKSNLTYYTQEEFSLWCDKARLFGIVAAALLFPSVLMDAIAASKYFNDPDTFREYLDVDRSYPVITYENENRSYKNRLLEIFEEIIDRYILYPQVKET